MKSKPISLITQDGNVMYLRRVVLRYRYLGTTVANFKVTGNVNGSPVTLLDASIPVNTGDSIQSCILQWVKAREVPSIQWEIVNGGDIIIEGVKLILDKNELSENNEVTVDANP